MSPLSSAPAAQESYAYPASLRALHWLMALIIFAAIALGVVATYMTPHTPERTALLAVHKSLGLTALALVVLRLILRAVEASPQYREPLSAFVLFASRLGHIALYALMFALPISGYAHSSAAGANFRWFGLFPVSLLIGEDNQIDHSAGFAHYILAWTIGGVLVVHLGAVLWHTAIRRDGVLQRMWPGAGS